MNKNEINQLQNIFENNLDVGLLAENIMSFSSFENAMKVKEMLSNLDFDLAGVEQDGRIVGYIERVNLGDGQTGNYTKYFSSNILISDSTPLIDLLNLFKENKFLFVLERNEVKKIVTIADVHKQPIRMLAFSLISLLEMSMTKYIESYFLNEEWKSLLSEGRLKNTYDMYNKKKEKNEALTLLESTQFVDKATIIGKTENLRSKLKFTSRIKTEKTFNKIREIRDNIAHAQETIYSDVEELIDILVKTHDLIIKIAE